MGIKLNWTGLAMMTTLSIFGWNGTFTVAGAIIFIIGVILMWMDK
jgi:hypothetical protein